MAIVSFSPDFGVWYVPKADRENIDKEDVCMVKIKPSTQKNSDAIRARGLRKSIGVKGLNNGEIDDTVLNQEMKALFISNVIEIKDYLILEGDTERNVTDSAELYEISDSDFIQDILLAIQTKSILEAGQKKT